MILIKNMQIENWRVTANGGPMEAIYLWPDVKYVGPTLSAGWLTREKKTGFGNLGSGLVDDWPPAVATAEPVSGSRGDSEKEHKRRP